MAWITKRKPPLEKYVLVFVGDYCESEYQVAKWDGDNWESDSGDTLNEFVKGWCLIDQFVKPKVESGISFLEALKEVLVVNGNLQVHNLNSVNGWPTTESGESLILENYEFKELNDSKLIIFGGADWQEPMDVTIELKDGGLIVTHSELSDISSTEPLSEEEVLLILK